VAVLGALYPLAPRCSLSAFPRSPAPTWSSQGRAGPVGCRTDRVGGRDR